MKQIEILKAPFTADERAQFVLKYNCVNITETDTEVIAWEETELDKQVAEIENEITLILQQLDTLDQKRIRASLEPSVKDKKTGETWLDYYNNQAVELRNRMDKLKKDIKILVG